MTVGRGGRVDPGAAVAFGVQTGRGAKIAAELHMAPGAAPVERLDRQMQRDRRRLGAGAGQRRSRFVGPGAAELRRRQIERIALFFRVIMGGAGDFWGLGAFAELQAEFFGGEFVEIRPDFALRRPGAGASVAAGVGLAGKSGGRSQIEHAVETEASLVVRRGEQEFDREGGLGENLAGQRKCEFFAIEREAAPALVRAFVRLDVRGEIESVEGENRRGLMQQPQGAAMDLQILELRPGGRSPEPVAVEIDAGVE